LRVVSQDKLFNPSVFYSDEKQFTLYISLLTDTEKYIKVMESKGLDDKFKEVYAISEKLKSLNLPTNKSAYLKVSTRIAKEKQEILDQCKKGFDELSVNGLPFDITLDDFLAQYPNALSKKKYKLTKGNKFNLYQPKNSYYFYSTEGKFDFLAMDTMYTTIETDDISIIIKDNKIIGYQKQIYWYAGKDSREDELINKYNELYSQNSHLNNCTEKHYDEVNLPDGKRQVSYWKFKNKTALINKSYSTQEKFYFHSLIYRVTKSDQAIEGF